MHELLQRCLYLVFFMYMLFMLATCHSDMNDMRLPNTSD